MTDSSGSFWEEGRRQILICLGLAILTASFLWIFRAVELSSNSLGYARSVSSSPLNELFYAPHLLFQPILLLFHTALGPISECGVTCAGQIHSIFWATVSVVCMNLLLARVTGSVLLGLVGATLLLVSHDFWVFATQLEVYVPLTGCFLVLATLLVFGAREWSPLLFTAACGIIWALATVYHQAGVIMFLPILAYFVAQYGVNGWKRIASISILAGGFVLAAYVRAYVTIDPPMSFLAWTLSLANVPLTDWGSTGHWTLPELRRGLFSQVTSLAVLPDEVRSSQGGLQRRGEVVLLSLLAFSAFQVIRGDRPRQIRVFLLVWFLAFFFFFSWWDPRVHKFFLPSVPPLIALGVLMLQDARAITERLVGGRRWALVFYEATTSLAVGITILVMFVFTLVASVMPLRGDTGPVMGPNYYEAAILEEIAPSDCVVLAFGHHVLPLRHYFDGGRRVDTERSLYERYYFYQEAHEGSGQTEPGEGLVGGEPCTLTNLYFVSERRFNNKVEDYIEAPDWPSFLDWFFSVEQTSGNAVTHHPFSFVFYSERPPYLLVDRTRRVVAERDYLRDALTRETRLRQREVDRFPAFPGRDREFIFGYSGNENSSTPTDLWTEFWRVLRLI